MITIIKLCTNVSITEHNLSLTIDFYQIKFLSLIDYDCETPSLFEKLVSIEIGLSYLNLKYILCKIDITKD